jgi:hypothetical protein
VLPASRGFLKEDEDKWEGCVAQGLYCNIWNRAQSPKLLSYTLKMGGGNCPGVRRGTRAFQLQDVMWKPGMPSLTCVVFSCIVLYCLVLCLYWHVLIRIGNQALQIPNQHGARLTRFLIILVQNSFTFLWTIIMTGFPLLNLRNWMGSTSNWTVSRCRTFCIG